ncbi:hypothetical protein L7F22_006170 [Adiantum nelumboides]|nr:hypothetical protein [Adiantum nelumboides]
MVSVMQVKRLVRKRDCTTALVMLREAEDDTKVQSEASTTDTEYLQKPFFHQFLDLFPDELPTTLPPRRPVDHTIDLIPGQPPPVRAPYRVSYALSRMPKATNFVISGVQIEIPACFKNEYLTDKDFRDAFRALKSLNPTPAEMNMFASYTVMDGLLYYLDRICVPHNGALRKILIQEHHEVPFAAHPGINKTSRFLSTIYFWPQMQQNVIKYVKACHSCQIMEASRQLPQGLFQPLPVPKERWESISMDFITTLPCTTKGNAQILVIVAYGHTPLVPTNFVLQDKVALVDQLVQEMQDILVQVRDKLVHVQQKYQKHANKHRRHAEFNEGDLVLLYVASHRYKTVKSVFPKLRPRFYGPFKIIKKNSVVSSYKLELPPSWGKLHPTFHISWLKQYIQGDSLVRELPSYVPETEDEHVILVPEMILDVRQKETRRKLTREFLVKWMDLDESDSTWQTDEEMQQYPNLLQKFFDKRQIFL